MRQIGRFFSIASKLYEFAIFLFCVQIALPRPCLKIRIKRLFISLISSNKTIFNLQIRNNINSPSNSVEAFFAGSHSNIELTRIDSSFFASAKFIEMFGSCLLSDFWIIPAIGFSSGQYLCHFREYVQCNLNGRISARAKSIGKIQLGPVKFQQMIGLNYKISVLYTFLNNLQKF